MYDLNGVDILGLFANEFVTASETPFTEEIALQVSSHSAFLKTVVLNDQQVLMGCMKGIIRSGWLDIIKITI